PGDRLQEDALGQLHAFVGGEFLRRHDLAARDARHVGHDGLDLGDAALAEELMDVIGHGITWLNLFAARSRAASPNALKSAVENASWSDFHSGCHCTASAKRVACATRNASTRPSSACASAMSPGASCRTPWWCSELTVMRERPAMRASWPSGTSVTSCAGPYCSSSGCVLSS